MATDRQRQQKKKLRDENARKKVLQRRQVRLAEQKLEHDAFKRIRRVKKLKKALDVLDTKRPLEDYLYLPDGTLTQLEKNVQVLRQMEAEHIRLTKERQERNDELEKEGHLTLESKINALHQRTVEEQRAEGIIETEVAVDEEVEAEVSQDETEAVEE